MDESTNKTITIPLNDEFYLDVKKTTLLLNRTEPLELDYNKQRPMKIRLYQDPINTFHLQNIHTKLGVVVNAQEIYEFTELLGSFVGGCLDSDKTYGFTYQDSENGFSCKIATKNKKISLQITTHGQNIYLDKYNCRVINKKFSKIDSQCRLQEFS